MKGQRWILAHNQREKEPEGNAFGLILLLSDNFFLLEPPMRLERREK